MYFSWVLNSYKQLRDLEILSRKLEMLKVLYFQANEKKHLILMDFDRRPSIIGFEPFENYYFTVLLVLFYKITNTERI